MRVLDLFSGLGGWSAAALARGHDVRTVDLDPKFRPTYVADIRRLDPGHFGEWRPDLILASPPCERFTTMVMGSNWTPGREPKNQPTLEAVEVVGATLRLIRDLDPAYWVIENPRAMLRRIPVMDGLERRTITQCRYGSRWQKPTDLWGGFPPTLKLRGTCGPGDACHESAPRGSHHEGVQAFKYTAEVRAEIPYALGEAVVVAAEEARARPPLEPLGLQAPLGLSFDLMPPTRRRRRRILDPGYEPGPG